MVNVAAIVIAKQNRYIRAFRVAGAIGFDTAKTLEELDIRESPIFNGMVMRGIFERCGNDLYYLNEARLYGLQIARRNRMLIILVLVVLVALLFSNR